MRCVASCVECCVMDGVVTSAPVTPSNGGSFRPYLDRVGSASTGGGGGGTVASATSGRFAAPPTITTTTNNSYNFSSPPLPAINVIASSSGYGVNPMNANGTG